MVSIFIKYAIDYSPALQSTGVVVHHASSQPQLLSEACMAQGRVTLVGQSSSGQEPRMLSLIQFRKLKEMRSVQSTLIFKDAGMSSSFYGSWPIRASDNQLR